MATDKTYFALRFRQNDTLHKRGDIQNCMENALYIGQTAECDLRLPSHPEYADCCYAVIVREDDGWMLIRQETDATISVNGKRLQLMERLNDGDKIAFDHTLVEFSVIEGRPQVNYVSGQSSYLLWSFMTVIGLTLCGVVFYLFHIKVDVYSTFADEITSIYSIRSDSLIVLRNSEPLDTICLGQNYVGTGFVTDDGYFVTARHCVEFWLAEEDELKTNYSEISSKAIRYAIDAESDTTLQLISKVSIFSSGGELKGIFSSEDFTMDKENDLIYEYGTVTKPYLWRSVVGKYENHQAELGDVAVMKWKSPGSIHLDDGMTPIPHDAMLYGFGYPQSEKASNDLIYQSGRLFGYNPHNKFDYFACDVEFRKGLSGGPVFLLRNTSLQQSKAVVGITSRIADKGTLCIPSAQIRKLIKGIDKNERKQ
jgi:hypothetical protein